MENQALDLKNRELKNGDLVILADADGLLNDDVMHIKGDILQFICCSSDDYAVGCFIHCKSNKRTDIFADRTLLIKKIESKIHSYYLFRCDDKNRPFYIQTDESFTLDQHEKVYKLKAELDNKRINYDLLIERFDSSNDEVLSNDYIVANNYLNN